MITNKVALKEIQEEWRGVEFLRGKLQAALLGSFAQGASFAIFIADAAHNLPFVHACAVLNDTLKHLEKEGLFKCESIFLGPLLAASENKLSWIDYSLIKDGVKRRNKVAHKGVILPRGECWHYIDGIKAQLVSWKIIDAS